MTATANGSSSTTRAAPRWTSTAGPSRTTAATATRSTAPTGRRRSPPAVTWSWASMRPRRRTAEWQWTTTTRTIGRWQTVTTRWCCSMRTAWSRTAWRTTAAPTSPTPTALRWRSRPPTSTTTRAQTGASHRMRGRAAPATVARPVRPTIVRCRLRLLRLLRRRLRRRLRPASPGRSSTSRVLGRSAYTPGRWRRQRTTLSLLSGQVASSCRRRRPEATTVPTRRMASSCSTAGLPRSPLATRST